MVYYREEREKKAPLPSPMWSSGYLVFPLSFRQWLSKSCARRFGKHSLCVPHRVDSGFHPGRPGSIPGMGRCSLFLFDLPPLKLHHKQEGSNCDEGRFLSSPLQIFPTVWERPLPGGFDHPVGDFLLRDSCGRIAYLLAEEPLAKDSHL